MHIDIIFNVPDNNINFIFVQYSNRNPYEYLFTFIEYLSVFR